MDSGKKGKWVTVPRPKRPASPGVAIRLAAIALGIASGVQMARHGFRIPLNDYLNNVINLYDGALSVVGIIVEPLARSALVKLREWLGVDLHLLPHWRHVLVLLWLYFGSQARAGWAPFLNRWGKGAFDIGWGVACALFGGVAAGTVSLSSPALFFWPLVATVLYRFGEDMWMATFLFLMKSQSSRTGTRVSWFRFLADSLRRQFRNDGWRAVVAIVVGFAFAIDGSPSPGLIALIVFVAIQAVIYLRIGFTFPLNGEQGGDFVTRFDNPATRNGLNILAVLGGATFVVWLGAFA